jgi:hypothetical protein
MAPMTVETTSTHDRLPGGDDHRRGVGGVTVT